MPNHSKRKPRRFAREIDAYILDVLEDAQRPLAAYAIVDQSSSDNQSLLPTQVYRSLNRLQQQNKIERIVTLNAFVRLQNNCHSMHLLCQGCGSYQAIEAESAYGRLLKVCSDIGFKARAQHIEVLGRCRQCKLDSYHVVI